MYHNCPSYSSEYLLCWLRRHLFVEMNSLTVKKPKSELLYYLLWKWSHGGIKHWSRLREPTDSENSPSCGWRIQHSVNTGQSSQHRINVPSASTPWNVQGHSGTRPSGCRKGIKLLRIWLWLCRMTCLIRWMVLCELSWWRWMNGRKTYTSLWSLCDRSCPNIMLK